MKKPGHHSVTPTTTIRLPPELHAEIKECAARNGQSMNAEIIHRLSTSVGKPLQIISEENKRTHELLLEILKKID